MDWTKTGINVNRVSVRVLSFWCTCVFNQPNPSTTSRMRHKVNIYSHPQTVSFYQNSSVWLDTQDARSRDRNPSNFTLDCVSDHSATKRTREIYICIHIYTRLIYIYIYFLQMNRSTREFIFRLFILIQHVFLTFYVVLKCQEHVLKKNKFSRGPKHFKAFTFFSHYPHIWPSKSRTTSSNIHTAALWGYGM